MNRVPAWLKPWLGLRWDLDDVRELYPEAGTALGFNVNRDGVGLNL